MGRQAARRAHGIEDRQASEAVESPTEPVEHRRSRLSQLRRIGRVDQAIVQQADDILETPPSGEFIERVSTYDQLPGQPVHVRQGRLGRNHVIQSAGHRGLLFIHGMKG